MKRRTYFSTIPFYRTVLHFTKLPQPLITRNPVQRLLYSCSHRQSHVTFGLMFVVVNYKVTGIVLSLRGVGESLSQLPPPIGDCIALAIDDRCRWGLFIKAVQAGRSMRAGRWKGETPYFLFTGYWLFSQV